MRRAAYDARETKQMHALHGRELASFGRRAAALLLDFAIAGLLFLLLVYPAAVLLRKLGAWTPTSDVNLKLNFYENWYSIVWLVAYFGIATWLGNGATPGKRLFRIRAVSLAHERMGLWHSVERALGYGASALEFGFGFLQFFIHPNRRTVHDRIGETIVVTEPRRRSAPAGTPGSVTEPPPRS